MTWLTFRIQHEPGFRFILLDAVYILAALGLSAWVYSRFPGSSLFAIPLYIVFTFFLFCNVFRIGNLLEALWYVPFAGMAAYTLLQKDYELFWWLVLLVLEPWKGLLAAHQIVRGPYIGAGHAQAAAWRAERANRGKPGNSP